jgi:hypothetical protein
MFGPPAYPPVSHYPYGASVGTAPPQPWGYAQYPVIPPQLTSTLAQHAATGDEYSSPHGDTRVAATGGGASVNDAASLPMAGARPGRSYPNKEVRPGGTFYLRSHNEAGF